MLVQRRLIQFGVTALIIIILKPYNKQNEATSFYSAQVKRMTNAKLHFLFPLLHQNFFKEDTPKRRYGPLFFCGTFARPSGLVMLFSVCSMILLFQKKRCSFAVLLQTKGKALKHLEYY